MKRYPAVILFVLYGAAGFCQNTKGKYFEGIVDYEIKAESHMPGVSDNEVRERLGSKLRLHYKNGTYMREYIDGAGYTLNRTYYIRDKNVMYMHNLMDAPDTLYMLSGSDELFLNYAIRKGETERILGVDCPSMVITAKHISPYTADTTILSMIYYFSPDLPVDPAWSKDVYIWKNVIPEYKSIATKFIEDDPMLAKQTFTAVKVTWQPVPDEIFKLDPKLVQVKVPK